MKYDVECKELLNNAYEKKKCPFKSLFECLNRIEMQVRPFCMYIIPLIVFSKIEIQDF